MHAQEVKSIHVLCRILKLAVCTASEAKLAALFLNMKEVNILRLMLEEMDPKQLATQKQRSHSMEVRFFWMADQAKQNFFRVIWHPGQSVTLM